MTLLRHKMLNDLKGRRLAPKTQTAYVDAVAGLARYYKKSPDLLTPDQIQRYPVYLPEERKLAWSSCNVVLCGLVFCYRTTLNRPDLACSLPPRKKRHQLFDVFSPGDVERLLTNSDNHMHRMLLMITYACGLRVSETVGLHLTDIDSNRMLVHIRQSKGNKDRFVPLSEKLLSELRQYWVIKRPTHFSGRPGSRKSSVFLA